MRRIAPLLTLFALGVTATAAAQRTWRTDIRPTLDIGSTSTSGTILFARVSGATRLTDGTIVIADGDDKTLHFFDNTGNPLRTAGREGSGPGEFRQLSWLGRCGGDSLHVWDFSQRRMAVFAPNGAFVRQYSIPSDTSVHTQPLMNLAGSPRGVIVFQGQPLPPKTRVAAKDPATTTYLAVAGHRVFADSASTITSYEPGGGVVTLKLAIPQRATTPEQRSRAAASTASMAPMQLRQLAEDSLKVAPMPAMLPPYSALFGDSEGVLWVQLTVLGDPSTRLRAVNTSGKTLGEVPLPANLTVYEIGRDYILGSYDDTDDLPHFARFRLHRGR